VVVSVLVDLMHKDLPVAAKKAIHTGMTSQDVLDAPATLRACEVHQFCDDRLAMSFARSSRCGRRSAIAGYRFAPAINMPETGGLEYASSLGSVPRGERSLR